MKPRFFLYILFSMMLAYLSVDIYLPALPGMRAHFGVTITSLQLTLSIYLIGIASSQLIFGPLIDRFGYRSLALLGAAIFIVFSVLCAASQNLTELVIARFFQAFSAGMVALIARASLPRVLTPEQLVKIYFYLASIMSISPAMAPVLGGYLAAYAGWQSIFLFLALMGFLILWLIYKEQKLGAIVEAKQSLKPIDVIKTYFSVLSHKKYLAYLLMVMSTFFTYFAFISQSPFIFHRMGYVNKEIGAFYLWLAFSFAIATQIARFVSNYLAPFYLIRIGFFFDVVGVVLLLGVGFLGAHNAYELIFPMCIYCIGNAFANPVSMSQAASLFPHRAGYAASLINSTGLISAGVASNILQPITQGSLVGVASFMLFVTILGISAYAILSRLYHKSKAAA